MGGTWVKASKLMVVGQRETNLAPFFFYYGSGIVTNGAEANLVGTIGTIDSLTISGDNAILVMTLQGVYSGIMYQYRVTYTVPNKATSSILSCNILVELKGLNDNYSTILNDPLSLIIEEDKGIYTINLNIRIRIYFMYVYIKVYYTVNIVLQVTGATVLWQVRTEKKGTQQKGTRIVELSDNTRQQMPTLNIIWSTDWLGSNLSEIICLAEGDYLRDEQYPVKLVGKYSWFKLEGMMSDRITPKGMMSYFSKHPNLLDVMIGRPTRTYLQRAEEINKTDLHNVQFYFNLLSFMSLRYFLGGLTSGILTRLWLLQSRTEQFYSNLLNSEFSKYISLFTITYKGYDKYMKY
jgi:hypothetical protein